SVDVELPRARNNSALNRECLGSLRTEGVSHSGSNDGRLAVLEEDLPLVLRHHEFVEDLTLVLYVNSKLGKGVLRILVNAAKPVVVGHALDPRNAQDTVPVGYGKGLDDRRPVDHHQAVDTGHVHSRAEGLLDQGQEAEEK